MVRRIVLPAVILSFAVACTSAPKPRPIVAPVLPALPVEVIQARVAEADTLAAKGCYLCLRDASVIYESLIFAVSDEDVIRKAVDTDLMMALREFELSLPASGAYVRAKERSRGKPGYDAYFGLLDIRSPSSGTRTRQQIELEMSARRQFLSQIDGAFASNPVAAYFLLTYGPGSAYWSPDQGTTVRQSFAAAFPNQLAVQYKLAATAVTFPSRIAEGLLAAEPRFAEVRLITGQRALFGGGVVSARRQFAAAHELLPESLVIKSLFAATEFAYARYAQALTLLDEILARGPDDGAQLMHAQSLSYLKRYREAIAELDQLLNDPSRTPGDKYYWRAWNKLQLEELQPAYDDATAALRFMSTVDAYRLAGIATFNLEKLDEARGYFDEALKISDVDCDSIQYLAQIDAAERKWPAAATRFARAAECFHESIGRMSERLAKTEADNADGLLDAQIAALRADIEMRQLLEKQSRANAAASQKNLGLPSPAH